MSEINKMSEGFNVIEDDGINLEELIHSAKNQKEEKTESAEIINDEVEEVSPLEMAKRDSENDKIKGGIVLNNDEFKDDGPKKSIIYNDDRMKSIDEEIKSYDDNLLKRERVIVIKKPTNAIEYIQLMDELNSVVINPDGSTTIDMKDKYGNPLKPAFIRVREKDEPLFDFSILSEYEKEHMKKEGTLTEEVKTASKDDEDENSNDDEENNNEEELTEEKKKLVEVIIDKTGLGSDFMFTDDERKKIEEADVIRVKEVQVIDIETLKTRKSNKSFQDIVNSFETIGNKTTICFPSSGFKAQMCGLSQGALTDILLINDGITFDRYYKRLSVIYNNMKNISSGNFESFEDFLKSISYIDIALAFYGLYISTEQEEQFIGLKCGKPKCAQNFNWKYRTRSLLKLERCSTHFLEKLKEVATAPAMDYDKLKKEAPVNQSKFVKLPDSGTICELGIISAYELLYNVVPTLDPAKFEEEFGTENLSVYNTNRLQLFSIRSIHVPDNDGNYVECSSYRDILDAMYRLSPKEANILRALAAEIQSGWDIVFSFGDVVCPHCGTVTKNMDIDLEELVFQMFSRMMNTSVDVKNIQGF